jgi:putative transposase
MANTYSQINIHVVFSVKHRENIITKNFSDDLFKYISGILKNDGHYSLAVNGHKDHVHIFFELNPKSAPADVVRIVKTNSSKWINENKFVAGKFNWQEGYGVFSHSHSQQNEVIKYIMNQEKHHKQKTFREEYLGLLEKYEIDFDDHYIFEFYE